jgi:hypothetical protein
MLFNKSEWTIELINRLKKLGFVLDVDFNFKLSNDFDWNIIIIVDKISTDYISPIVDIVEEIEWTIYEETNYKYLPVINWDFKESEKKAKVNKKA